MVAGQQAPGIHLALAIWGHFYVSCEDQSQASGEMELGMEVEEAVNKDGGERLGVSVREALRS